MFSKRSMTPLRAALLALFALVATMAVITTASAGDASRSSATGRPPLVLDRSRTGEDAITALGGRLNEIAAQNDLAGPDLAALLRADSAAWLDASGRLFFVEPAAGTAEAPVSTGAAPFPVEQTFLLHSMPASDRVIFLDFDGHTVEGTGWNQDYGESFTTEPYSIDEDGSTFSFAEREEIQQVWQRVAEDFAPFNVDVTTEAPAQDAITRNGDNDSAYGTRVCQCGGVAYVGTFDNSSSHAYYQPAFVFTQGVGHEDKFVAEAASHEAAHNLGLLHDGTRRQGYYEGHGSWAPIMGVGYYKAITQWSRGEYNKANNSEDDFAVMTSHGAEPRDDDHADTLLAATAISGPTFAENGLISSRTDVDTFELVVNEPGQLSVAASPAPRGPNLDIGLELLSSTGQVVASADPASGSVAGDTSLATGLDASLSASVTTGTYFLRVDGVGAGSPRSTGYSDYASVGAYSLTGELNPSTTPVLRVSSIEMNTDNAGRKIAASATVTITDGDNPQGGVSVTVTWSGRVTGTTTGETDADGSVILISPSTSAKHGTFTATVTSVAGPGSDYDPGLNAETTDSISV